MDKWSRRQLHSHSYRVPDSFQDEAVVVVGCHASGVDIALELRAVARDVHVSVKSVDDGVAVSPGMRKAASRHHNLHLHPQAKLATTTTEIKPSFLLRREIWSTSVVPLLTASCVLRRSSACARMGR
jgi:cation diffusion facilitator CzcD-associated flavoprotein CzcO